MKGKTKAKVAHRNKYKVLPLTFDLSPLTSSIRWIKGGVTAPVGFKAAGVACGVKRWRKDLALVYSEFPAVAAGVFTTNRLQAAPVIVTRQHLRSGHARAILVNSGNANCATGKQGLEDAKEMAKIMAKVLRLDTDEVLVASTGIIGQRLPMDAIRTGAITLVEKLSVQGSHAAAEAILTTDHAVKEAAVRLALGGKKITLGAIAKGAGMIAPNMATMLCFVTTDVCIARPALKKALTEAVQSSFNSITVDGEMSTNDMVLILANHQAKNRQIGTASNSYETFALALKTLLERIAQMMIDDAEGATRFVEINVTGASGLAEAKKVAMRIANSLLVKTMLHGADPNWGRVAACVGSSGVPVDMTKVAISIGPVAVYLKGEPMEHNRDQLRRYLKEKKVQIQVDLGQGKASSRVWTTDLSAEYVKINAGYTT